MPVARKVWQLAAAPSAASRQRFFDHAEYILTGHAALAKAAPDLRILFPLHFFGHGAPERGAFRAGDAGRFDVSVEIFLRFVVGGEFVMLAAFLVQSHPP